MPTGIMMLRWSTLCEPRNAVTAVALAFGLLAAILMARHPPIVVQTTKDGQAVVTWLSGPTDEGKRRGWYHYCISKTAPWLLALAFVLQFIALLLP
jgi:hypothetical protein